MSVFSHIAYADCWFYDAVAKIMNRGYMMSLVTKKQRSSEFTNITNIQLDTEGWMLDMSDIQ